MTIDISEINTQVARNSGAFCVAADNRYNNHLLKIAEDIYEHRHEKPVILLSGPSGSGKTTSAMMLEQLLDSWQCETHTLSMDNYFMPLDEDERVLAAQGKLDLESPGRVDIPLLNEQLGMIIDCKLVDIPKYSFSQSCRVPSEQDLARKPGELVLLEGIHALNPDVITIPDDQTSRIYVSVRTRVTAGEIALHPSKIRLMRRMIRDKLFRNRSLSETIGMFPNVEQGEQRYIAPYKSRANYDVDTFFAYELSVYKALIMDELAQFENNRDFEDLDTILKAVEPMDSVFVPKSSLIREFVGDGQFSY